MPWPTSLIGPFAVAPDEADGRPCMRFLEKSTTMQTAVWHLAISQKFLVNHGDTDLIPDLYFVLGPSTRSHFCNAWKTGGTQGIATSTHPQAATACISTSPSPPPGACKYCGRWLAGATRWSRRKSLNDEAVGRAANFL